MKYYIIKTTVWWKYCIEGNFSEEAFYDIVKAIDKDDAESKVYKKYQQLKEEYAGYYYEYSIDNTNEEL